MKKIFQKEITRRVLYRYDVEEERYVVNYCSKIGVMCFEQEPHSRTVFLTGNENVIKRIHFPYFQFTINYVVDEKKENPFIFMGQDGQGLKISCSTKPIEKMEEEVYLCPFEVSYIICTPHPKNKNNVIYDRKGFKTLEDLKNNVISSYWGLNHYVRISKIKDLEKEKVLNFDWSGGRVKASIKKVLNAYYDINFLTKAEDEDTFLKDS
jgi:hypothetical protein